MRTILLTIALLTTTAAIPPAGAYYSIHFAAGSSACTLEGLVEIDRLLVDCPSAAHFAAMTDNGCQGDHCVVDLWFEARAYEYDTTAPQMILSADVSVANALAAEPAPLCSTSGAPQWVECEFADRLSFALVEGECRDLVFRTRAQFDGDVLRSEALSVVNACRDGNEVDFYAPDGASWYASEQYDCDAPLPFGTLAHCGAAAYGSAIPGTCDSAGCELIVYTHAWGRGYLSLPRLLVADVVANDAASFLCADATQSTDATCAALVTIDVPVAAGACAPILVRAKLTDPTSATTTTAQNRFDLCRDANGDPRLEATGWDP